jgi:hypothetical protein
MRVKWRVLYTGLCGVPLLYLLLSGSTETLVTSLSTQIGGQTRPDYFSSETLVAREGLYLRAIDAALFLFPFGAGSGMAPYAMNYSLPMYMAEFASEMAKPVYDSEVRGERLTNVHNRYLEYIVEHGLLGIVGLVSFMFIIVRNFMRWQRTKALEADDRSKFYVSQACIYAVLLGLGIHNLFESTYNPFWIYFMFGHFSFVLLRPVRSEPVTGQGYIKMPLSRLAPREI